MPTEVSEKVRNWPFFITITHVPQQWAPFKTVCALGHVLYWLLQNIRIVMITFHDIKSAKTTRELACPDS